MLRIYLDQNKWVDLARAATGHRLGKRYEDALAMCRAGVAAFSELKRTPSFLGFAACSTGRKPSDLSGASKGYLSHVRVWVRDAEKGHQAGGETDGQNTQND